MQSQQPEVFKLSNDLPVILQHLDGPVAATYWWVNVGSADEMQKEAGFAHFLEHMLFKDSAAKDSGRASTGKMARAIESLGGDINAYTSFDQTVYHVTCAETHWLKVLDVFGAMAKPQRFLKEDFESEREVILEELRKNEDSPGRQMFTSLFAETFKVHPYGRPVIGFAKTLNAAKVQDLEAFYKRSYVSSRMGLVIVGPLHDAKGSRKKEILGSLEKYFGSRVIKKVQSPRRVRPQEEPRRAKLGLVSKPFDVQTPALSFSFRVPDLLHHDVPSLDVLAGVLGMGEMGRLYQKLFCEKTLVNDVSGAAYIPKDPGMLYFQAEVADDSKITPAAEALFLELDRIKREGPTDQELDRVLVNTESEKIYSMQTADGLASRLGFLNFVMGDLRYDEKYLDLVRRVDAETVKEAAKTYLNKERMSGVILVPKSSKYDVKEIRVLGDQILGAVPKLKGLPPVKTKNPKPSSPVHETVLPNGLKLVFYPRSGSGVFSAHASVLGGVRLEDAKKSGLSHLLSLTWNKGTPSRTAQDIATKVEGLAASLDGFSGRNSLGLQMTGLAKNWAALSDLFGEVLTQPQFLETEVAHSKRVQTDSIKSVEDHTSQLCSKLFLETLFEHHPYGRMTIGNLQTLEGLQTKDLKEVHRQWVRPERLVISISGDLKMGQVERWIEQLRFEAMGSPFVVPEIEAEPGLKAPRWVERHLGREQVHILTGTLGSTLYDEDRRALQILSNILGGQSGRLFIELREKKSLAYTVAPVSLEGIETGYVATYIACSPSKQKEALKGMTEVLEKLAKTGPTEAEMARAKEYLLGRRAMDLQSDSALASYFGLERLYDLKIKHHSEVEKEIRRVSAKEVKRACEKYFIKPFRVTSVVG